MTTIPPVHPEDERVIRSFPSYQGSGTKGFITNFLGVKTRTAFHSGFAGCDGGVEGHPVPANCHATSLEWAGGLRAVLEAGQEFVAVELGAGWAPVPSLIEGEIPAAMLTDFEKHSSAVAPVAFKEGPIAFALEVKLVGRQPTKFPELPKAWTDAAKSSKAPLLVPDGLIMGRLAGVKNRPNKRNRA